MNLTRHTSAEQFVNRDVLDSYELSKLISEGEDVLDLGTGGGVPGVLLKILRPDLRITLCESVGKKADAVGAIVAAVNLNIEVFKGRGEERLEDGRFDVVVARAVGPLRKLLGMLREHWVEAGRLLQRLRDRVGRMRDPRRVAWDCCTSLNFAKWPNTRCPGPARPALS